MKMPLRIELLADHMDWVPILTKAFFAQWSHIAPGSSIEVWEAKLRMQCNRNGLDTTFVGILDGEPVASARLKKHDMVGREELSPWLAGVWVRPDLRGQGLGAQLVKAVEDEGRRSGFPHLYLWTPDRDKFYGRCGWSILDRPIYQSLQVTIMEKWV